MRMWELDRRSLFLFNGYYFWNLHYRCVHIRKLEYRSVRDSNNMSGLSLYEKIISLRDLSPLLMNFIACETLAVSSPVLTRPRFFCAGAMMAPLFLTEIVSTFLWIASGGLPTTSSLKLKSFTQT